MVALTRIKDEILRFAQDDKRKYSRINNFLVILNKRGTRAVKNLNLIFTSSLFTIIYYLYLSPFCRLRDIFPERGQRE